MSDLQATLEFSIELGRFYNVDLFQRGYYQIHVGLKTPPKLPCKTEVSLSKISEYYLVLPAHTVNGVAVSKTFQILYRSEDVSVNDVILFRLHVLVDSTKVLEILENLGLQLTVDLWFGEEECGSQITEKMECVSQRILPLHYSPTKGLHHYVPVVFDYYHLSAIDVTVYGVLVALHQPYISVSKPPKSTWANKGQEQSTLETVYFGLRSLSSVTSTSSRLQQACQIHRKICSILLSAAESLQENFEACLNHMASPNFKLEKKDCHARLEDLLSVLESFDNEEDLLQRATTDVTQLCAENVILWSQFLDVVTSDNNVLYYLAKEHHIQRVKRFAEGFFTSEYPKNSSLDCFEPSIHGHSDLNTLVRNSAYFQNLPPLPVECLDLDGDHTTMPIIFEDVYHDHIKTPTISPTGNQADENAFFNDSTDSDHAVQKTHDRIRSKSETSCNSLPNNDDLLHLHNKGKRKFIKNIKPEAFKRPSSYSCLNADSRSVPLLSDVVLVGYRKMSDEDIDNSLGLGTFGQTQTAEETSTSANLSGSISMTSLLARSCWSRSSVNSLPEFTSQPESVYNQPSMVHTSSSITDISLSLEPSKSDDPKWNKMKNKKSLTAPILHVECLDTSSPEDQPCSLKEKTKDGLQIFSKDTAVKDCHLSELSMNIVSDTAKDHVNKADDVYKDNVLNGESENECKNTQIPNGYDQREETSDIVTEQQLSADGAPVGFGEEKESGSKDLSSKTKPNSIKLKREKAKNIDDRLTIFELLKEEYTKNMERKTTTSLGSPEHTRNLGVPLATQKAISDTNIHKGLHPVNISTCSVEVYDGNITDNHSTPMSQYLKNLQSSSQTKSIVSSSSYPELSRIAVCDTPKLVSAIGHNTINFVMMRESLKKQLKYPGQLYSEYPTLASSIPYFMPFDDSDDDGFTSDLHLIVCVHGLDGNSSDLRLIRSYIEMALLGQRIEFLMSERNQCDTFAEFDIMSDRLVDEILYHIHTNLMKLPDKISFVGHSLGNIIIRSALNKPELAHLLPLMYTFLSLSGPHLGTLYNTSGLVNMGMWFIQKWKKSGSLLQLALKDHSDPRQTFLYKLSQNSGFVHFKNILLVGSSQDRYVPYHSTRVEMCRSALKDNSVFGAVYAEMVENLLQPVINNPTAKLIRYDVFHALPSTANTIIGRAAHIAVLDSELFLEKFLNVVGLKYFK